MIVKELIETLLTMDENAIVKIESSFGEYRAYEAQHVSQVNKEDKNTVVISCD